jgi:hypothetical protein
MPIFLWLRNIFVSFLGVVIPAISAAFVKKLALRGTVVAMFTTISHAFVSGINTLAQQLIIALPRELVIAWGWVMPSNFGTCLGIIMSGETIAWVYRQRIALQRLLVSLAG